MELTADDWLRYLKSLAEKWGDEMDEQAVHEIQLELDRLRAENQALRMGEIE